MSVDLDNPSPECSEWARVLEATIKERDALRRERDAYRKAKQENDERFMIERDEARAERDRYHVALTKISAIRDSIVGMQGFNFSEHAYPLVAALDEAGFKGAGYEIARANLGTLIEQRNRAEAERDQARAELEHLRGLINTPRTDDFFEAVRIEAAHQIERWGTEHDAGKQPADWIALLAFLTGKATMAYYVGDADKMKHHIVTVAAACLNWLRNLNGETTAFRPGVRPDHPLVATDKDSP